jgi:hypothetical protein
MGDVPTIGAVFAALVLVCLWLDDGMSVQVFYERLRSGGWTWRRAAMLTALVLIVVVLVTNLIGWGAW